jgi:transcriptional regulator with XRE-family HTH domain
MPKSIHRPEHQLFTDLLRDMRKQAGLTQATLAKKLKRPQTFVSTVERGLVRQDFLQLRDWCKRCGVSVADLALEFEAQLSIRNKAGKATKKTAGRRL